MGSHGYRKQNKAKRHKSTSLNHKNWFSHSFKGNMRDQVSLCRNDSVSNIMLLLEAPKRVKLSALFVFMFQVMIFFSSSGGWLYSLVYDHVYLGSTSIFQFHSFQAWLWVFLNLWVPTPLKLVTLSKGSTKTIRNKWYLHNGSLQ